MNSPLFAPFFIVCLGAVLGLSVLHAAAQRNGGFGHITRCQMPVNLGTTCATEKPGIKWYYQPKYGICLAFKYNGCGWGNNVNQFDTELECLNCRPRGAAGCAGLSGPVKDSNGKDAYCIPVHHHAPGQAAQQPQCPRGSRCLNLGHIGLCCDIAKQDIFDANVNPKCPNGNKPAQFTSGGLNLTLLGRVCSHDFCPDGYGCTQLQFFAHCCPL